MFGVCAVWCCGGVRCPGSHIIYSSVSICGENVPTTDSYFSIEVRVFCHYCMYLVVVYSRFLHRAPS